MPPLTKTQKSISTLNKIFTIRVDLFESVCYKQALNHNEYSKFISENEIRQLSLFPVENLFR